VREFLPLLFGIVAGWLVSRRPGTLKLEAALAAGVVLGSLASWINGELVESAWLVVFDIAQVAAALAMTFFLARRLRRAEHHDQGTRP
jgi:membrane-associated protease RseP (regulator of RpoE activity)